MKSTHLVTLLLLSTALTAAGLSACGGGGGGDPAGAGGGGGGTTPAPVTFVNWNTIQPNTTVSVPGVAQSVTYTWQQSTDTVTALTAAAPAAGEFRATYDASLQISSILLTTPATLAFSRALDTFGSLPTEPTITSMVSPLGERYFLTPDPKNAVYSWSYQSFGLWTTGVNTGNGTYGALSFGSTTPGSAIPTTGTLPFTGRAGGRYAYVNGAGNYGATLADVTATADFVHQTVVLSATATQATPDLGSTFAAKTNLNLSGTLSYNAATNEITGTVTTADGMTGTVTARFYGPNAEEIGGTFSVTSASPLGGYTGAFGGKR